MHKPAALLLLAAFLAIAASGCADRPAVAPAAPQTTMSIVGVIQDEGLAAVPGAHVSLRLLNRTTTSDAAGSFRFDHLTVSAYLVDVNATGFEPATLTAEPQTTTNSSLNFVLRKPTQLLPRTEVSHLKGILQCASEAVIISGSCGALLAFAGQDDPFQDTSEFQVGLGARWDSVVIDVDFDPSAHPGFDGLRLVVSGIDGSRQLDNYSQYGRFHDSKAFTARLDVNGTYEDGVSAVPSNLTAVRLTVYPQGHGWHQVCDPTGAFGCTAGAGAGNDVRFDLYVTTFYNQKAPEGYTLLAN